MATQPLRYQLPKKAIKIDCPSCGPKYRRTLSRYVDTRTGEPIRDEYGRCDRESNCGYHLSPYHRGQSGVSYADEVYEQWKLDNPMPAPRAKSIQRIRRSVTSSPIGTATSQATRRYIGTQPLVIIDSLPASTPVYTIPDEVFLRSLGHYDRNQFAWLLRQHFGMNVADDLLQRFQIGTSVRWPGACVFWYIDEQGRKRGGQIKLFDETFHTVKYINREGNKRSKTDWVHTALAWRMDQQQQPRPAWLTDYIENAERSPCLFGLPQLLTRPTNQPIAIVEAPKTAILCTPYFPQFVWLAVGALSYLNAERLCTLKGRSIVLFPDLNAYHDFVNEKGHVRKGWLTRANELRGQGFAVTISSYLEQLATDEQRAQGLDLADYLLEEWKGYPPRWDEPATIPP